MLKILAASMICAVFVQGPAAAADRVLWYCDISDRRAKVDWVPPEIALVVDAKGTVDVIDGLLILFDQSPKRGRVFRNDDRILRVNWTLKGAMDSQQQKIPNFGYNLRLNKKTGRVTVGAMPHGYSNRFSGRGTCKIRDK